jgi:hypothetical protein
MPVLPALNTTEGSEKIKERLYNLLPTIYRIEDANREEQLRALLAVIETELAAIEGDIEDLYENWFIETCEEWVIPYIGDLLGVRLVHAVESAGIYSLRPYVANTLAYRRRKGTAFVLEQLARDLTGWSARAVEFFQLLCTTQHLNHVRLENLCPLDLRDPDPLELLYGPFEKAAHTVAVRPLSLRHPDPRSGEGRYNIPNVGLFLWRLYPYEVEHATARCIVAAGDGCYTFSPLGDDVPLFNLPRTETEITHLAEEINAPGPLRRRALHDELRAWRQALADAASSSAPNGSVFRPVYFGNQPVFEIFVDGEEDPVPPEKILICDLSEWSRPDDLQIITPSDDPHCVKTPGCGVELEIAVAVDPELGRLAFPVDAEPDTLEVSYIYGFSSDVGGGPYDRRRSVADWLKPRTGAVIDQELWQIGVTKDPQTLADAPDPSQLVQTVQEAVAAWTAHVADSPEAFGLIALMDSRSYEEDLTDGHAIEIPAGSRLAIVAAEWPTTDLTSAGGTPSTVPAGRMAGRITPDDVRPHLLGDVWVQGTSGPDDQAPGELILDGLLIEGQLTVLEGDLGGLKVNHSTLVPGQGGLVVNSAAEVGMKNDRLTVVMERSICGPITLPEKVPELQLTDCVVDGTSGGIAAPGADVRILTSTVFGSTEFRSLEASDSIFEEQITVQRRQTGCVRFSYVPEDSRTPRRYRCQPGLALAEYAKELDKTTVDDLTEAEEAFVRARLKPRFTSTHYGDPAYAQLSLACPAEIRTGAEEGAEMGVFNHLQQPQREANLRAALEEYLRFGLEAGLFYVT